VNCSVLSASRDVSATKSITNQVFATVAQYNVYINVIDMQINKGCSIKFLSAQTILAVSIYKENATFVTDFNTTKVRYLDVIVAPRLMPYCIIKRISLYSIDAL
jgi:hypothetical protein